MVHTKLSIYSCVLHQYNARPNYVAFNHFILFVVKFGFNLRISLCDPEGRSVN